MIKCANARENKNVEFLADRSVFAKVNWRPFSGAPQDVRAENFTNFTWQFSNRLTHGSQSSFGRAWGRGVVREDLLQRIQDDLRSAWFCA